MSAPPVEMAPDAMDDAEALASLAGLDMGPEGAPFGDPEAPAPAGPAPEAPPFSAPAAPKGRRRRKAGEWGGDDVAPDVRALYTPETVGRAFTGLVDAVYRLAAAEPLTADERANVAGAFAYYCQKRAPADLGRFQPEVTLGLALLATIPPRMDRVVAVTVPWWRRLFRLKPAPATDTEAGTEGATRGE